VIFRGDSRGGNSSTTEPHSILRMIVRISEHLTRRARVLMLPEYRMDHPIFGGSNVISGSPKLALFHLAQRFQSLQTKLRLEPFGASIAGRVPG
jgi:hypothetical protein